MFDGLVFFFDRKHAEDEFGALGDTTTLADTSVMTVITDKLN